MGPEIVFATIAVFSILVGLPLAGRRIRPNRWYGLRVPATFADDFVWYEANAVAGRDLVALGAVLLVVTLVLPQFVTLSPSRYAATCGGAFVIGSLALTIRGWRAANRLLKERRGARP